MLNDTAPDVIARLSIGAEACADNIGSICIANRGNGFSVFINGGQLPDGRDERFFSASNVRCLRDAYEFAFSIAQQLIDDEVQIDTTIPRFPHVRVQLSGADGNVFGIIGRVQRALRSAAVAQEDIDSFWKDVSSAHSYEEALRTITRWVETT